MACRNVPPNVSIAKMWSIIARIAGDAASMNPGYTTSAGDSVREAPALRYQDPYAARTIVPSEESRSTTPPARVQLNRIDEDEDSDVTSACAATVRHFQKQIPGRLRNQQSYEALILRYTLMNPYEKTPQRPSSRKHLHVGVNSMNASCVVADFLMECIFRPSMKPGVARRAAAPSCASEGCSNTGGAETVKSSLGSGSDRNRAGR